MQRYFSRYIPAIVVAITGLSCSAGTVVSVSGPTNSAEDLGIFVFGLPPFFQAYAAVEFTTTMPIVDGVALVDFAFRSGPTVTAWLTDAIGPGTTASDVIASQSFGSETLSPVAALSGINIDPGTYFLVLDSPGQMPGAEWATTNSPTISGVGTFDGSFFGHSDPASSFAPGNTFQTTGTNYLQFEIDSGVPEPPLQVWPLSVLSAWRLGVG